MNSRLLSHRHIAAFGLIALASCASLGILGILPLRFSEPADRKPELRLLGPSLERPVGGAALRLWARIENPNRLGLTLREVTGDLHVADAEAIAVAFPIGVPLLAHQDTIVPLDVSIRFDDLPRLAQLARAAVTGQPLAYHLDGRFTVDAGTLGRPGFGPLTLLSGEIRVR